MVGRGAEGLRALRPAPIPAASLRVCAEDPHALLPVRAWAQQQRRAGHRAAAGVADPLGAGARAADDAKPRGDVGRGGGRAADGGVGAGDGTAG